MTSQILNIGNYVVNNILREFTIESQAFMLVFSQQTDFTILAKSFALGYHIAYPDRLITTFSEGFSSWESKKAPLKVATQKMYREQR